MRQQQKNAQQYRCFAQRQPRPDAESHCNSLSTTKTQPGRERMSGHGRNGDWHDAPVLDTHDKVGAADGSSAFKGIQQDRRYADPPTARPDHVGCARIAIAISSNIQLAHPETEQQREGDRPAEKGEQCPENPYVLLHRSHLLEGVGKPTWLHGDDLTCGRPIRLRVEASKNRRHFRGYNHTSLSFLAGESSGVLLRYRAS